MSAREHRQKRVQEHDIAVGAWQLQGVEAGRFAVAYPQVLAIEGADADFRAPVLVEENRRQAIGIRGSEFLQLAKQEIEQHGLAQG